MSAALISTALVLGEFTIASLLNFETLQVVINLLGKRDAGVAVAVALAALLLAALLLFLFSFADQSARRPSPTDRCRHRRIKQATFMARGASAPSRSGVRVQLVELCRTFAEVHALDKLTLNVAPGELVALLGPSGCGKTTALRVVAGLESVDQGHVLLDGRDITDLPANRRDMGVVFQAYSLFPHLTARQNVEFGMRLRGRPAPERHRAAQRLLELVHLEGRGGRYPHELSGGQQQRVALARALAIEPQVLLLDEPLSALDAKVRSQLRDEIRRVQTEVGITTLFVTHDQDEALAIADRVAVMFDGRLAQIASPTELYERPCSAQVAEFVGLSNRLPGIARRRCGGCSGQPTAVARRISDKRTRHRYWCGRKRSSSGLTGLERHGSWP